MLVLRILIGLGLAYLVLLLLAWRFQDRLAFPAPRASLPDPKRVGVENGEKVELVSGDGTKLVGWFLKPEVGEVRGGLRRTGEVDGARSNLPQPPPPFPTSPTSPGLLWFYGNGETVAAIWPIVREFQPPGTAVLVVDYPGYGGSGGRATEPALYAAAEAGYTMLATRPGVDPHRIFVYGRSLGSAVAIYTAAHRPVAGLILESPFTSAAAMAKHHYRLVPRFLLHLSLDNLTTVKLVHCPILLFHGDADRLVPGAMGMAVAAAAPGPVEVVLLHGSGHNDTYEIGGRAYRDKMWAFITGL